MPEGIGNALYLSTVHMPESNPDFGECSVMEYEYGFVVLCMASEYCPDWLKPIMEYARGQSCHLINFDRDDEELDGFTKYDW